MRTLQLEQLNFLLGDSIVNSSIIVPLTTILFSLLGVCVIMITHGKDAHHRIQAGDWVVDKLTRFQDQVSEEERRQPFEGLVAHGLVARVCGQFRGH